jgi:hypothetical protein
MIISKLLKLPNELYNRAVAVGLGHDALIALIRREVERREAEKKESKTDE